jgi:hypothetical protein
MMHIRTNLDSSRIAAFSECDLYRYWLLIKWDKTLPVIASVGLNPSTADEFKNDPTVARDVERADRLGFGSLLKLNLFPFRSTDPAGMKTALDPFGEWIDCAKILACAMHHRATMTMACWGNHGSHRFRSNQFRITCAARGYRLHFFEMNKTGEPCHPLYKPYALQPQPYEF